MVLRKGIGESFEHLNYLDSSVVTSRLAAFHRVCFDWLSGSRRCRIPNPSFLIFDLSSRSPKAVVGSSRPRFRLFAVQYPQE